MSENPQPQNQHVNPGGGAMSDNVNTSGGTFVARDRHDNINIAIQSPLAQEATPHNHRNTAPKPPADFVGRSTEYNALRELLLADGNAPVGITAIRGAGGYGKTTLAQALCHDPAIVEHFPNGIFWVGLTQEPGELTSRVLNLVENIIDQRPGSTTLDAAIVELSKALGDRKLLLVIDDVWQARHLAPFLQGGPNCTRLVTTRINTVLPQEAPRINVDAVQSNEATQLLGAGLGDGGEALEKLAARLGEWPLLLHITNALLRQSVGIGTSLSQAISDVNRALDEEGMGAFQSLSSADERHTSVASVLSASLRLLNEQERKLFQQLGCFPEDTDIPLESVAQLWKLSLLATKSLCIRLADLSLLQGFDIVNNTIRIHNVISSYLREQEANLTSPDRPFSGRYYPSLEVNSSIKNQRASMEQLILGTLLVKPESVDIVTEWLIASDFTEHPNRLIYETILSMWEQGLDVNTDNIVSQLNSKSLLDTVGGEEYLRQIASFGARINLAQVEQIARRIAKEALRRKMGVTDPTATLTQLELTIPVDLENFDATDIKNILTKIAELAKVDAEEIYIHDIRSGSTKITIELPDEGADRFIEELVKIQGTIENYLLIVEKTGQAIPLQRAKSEIVILCLASEPTDVVRLRLGDEQRHIFDSLERAEYGHFFRIQPVWATKVRDVLRYILRFRPSIMHFSGHGSVSGGLLFERADGRCQHVEPAALGELFGEVGEKIRCVVLNACYSEIQATEISKHVECVVGMQGAVQDISAIAFASVFYEVLAYGQSVDTAFNSARLELRAENLQGYDQLKLIASPQTDPTCVVFVPFPR